MSVREIARRAARFVPPALRSRLRSMLGPRLAPVAADWSDPFTALRAKWSEIPIGPSTRARTSDLLRLGDTELLGLWQRSRSELTRGEQWEHRGWYHELYRDAFRGRRVLDIGCGFGIDSLTFAQHGADVTLMDLQDGNLELVGRIGRLLGLEIATILIEGLASFDHLTEYDRILALGSLHHAPVELIAAETTAILAHLPIGGRWIQLAYPFSRWIRDGRPAFDVWGQMTDGIGTPWAEPYDLPKLLDVLRPATFAPVLVREFHGGDFIWFDLVRTA